MHGSSLTRAATQTAGDDSSSGVSSGDTVLDTYLLQILDEKYAPNFFAALLKHHPDALYDLGLRSETLEEITALIGDLEDKDFNIDANFFNSAQTKAMIKAVSTASPRVGSLMMQMPSVLRKAAGSAREQSAGHLERLANASAAYQTGGSATPASSAAPPLHMYRGMLHAVEAIAIIIDLAEECTASVREKFRLMTYGVEQNSEDDIGHMVFRHTVYQLENRAEVHQTSYDELCIMVDRNEGNIRNFTRTFTSLALDSKVSNALLQVATMLASNMWKVKPLSERVELANTCTLIWRGMLRIEHACQLMCGDQIRKRFACVEYAAQMTVYHQDDDPEPDKWYYDGRFWEVDEEGDKGGDKQASTLMSTRSRHSNVPLNPATPRSSDATKGLQNSAAKPSSVASPAKKQS